METIQIEYLGDLRTTAVHVQSGNQLLTDAPLDNKGKGETFSPTDLFVTALGGCIITTIGIAAQAHGFSVDGTKLRVTKIMAQNPRRIGEIIVEMDFPPFEYSDKEKKIIQYATHTCPVSVSLHPDVKQTIAFNFQ